MDGIGIVAGVALFWLAAVVSPGPNLLVVSRLALARSRGAALGAVAGVALASQLYGALTMFGLGAVVAGSAWLGTAARVCGGLYLVWLGLQAWRHAGEAAPVEAEGGRDALGGFRAGAATSLTNPKSFAFFLGLFAAMVPAEAPLAVKLGALWAGLATEVGWYGAVALALSGGAARRGYRWGGRVLDRCFGALFVAIGAALAAGR